MTQTGSSIALAGPPVVGLRGIAPGRECCGWKTRRRTVGACTPSPCKEGCNAFPRSEEHTYELQTLMRNSYAVFCLKKKTSNKQSKSTKLKSQINIQYKVR